jgi:hypothetical protein
MGARCYRSILSVVHCSRVDKAILAYRLLLFSGRSLIRLSETSLLRLGIVHPEHRQAIWREIAKLRLKTNILLLRDLERRQQQQQQLN